MLKKALYLGAALGTALVSSNAWAFGPGFTVDAYYVYDCADQKGMGENFKGDGLGARGLFKTGMGLFGAAEYQEADLDHGLGKHSDFRVGAGYELDMIPMISFFGKADYFHQKVDDDSAKGIGVYAGAEFSPLDLFSIYGQVGYLNAEKDDGPEYVIGGSLSFFPMFKIFAEYRNMQLDETDLEFNIEEYRVGLSFNFNT